MQTSNLKQSHQKNYNWDAMESFTNQPIWFVENVPSNTENKKFKDDLLANWVKNQSFEKLIDFWRESDMILDNNQALITRVVEAKDLIRKFIGEKGLGDGELVLVCHFKFIRYFTAKSFDKDRQPVDGKETFNCELIEYELI